MDPSFILPSGSKVTPVSAASKQGNGKLFTFTAAGWNLEGFSGGKRWLSHAKEVSYKPSPIFTRAQIKP